MEQLIINRYGLRLVHFVGYAMPPRIGYPIARSIATWLAARSNSRLVKAVRANQWVVTGETSNKKDLAEAVQAVLQNIARSIYELYHFRRRPETIHNWFVFEPAFKSLLEKNRSDPQGMILTGLHLSGFDLALQWACTNIYNPLLLTLPELGGIHNVEFEFRRKMGLNLVHGSPSGLRQSVRHLQQEGIVITGIDRPTAGNHLRPYFFKRPASLPNHHIFLALKAQVPLRMIYCRQEKDGKYHVSISSAVELERCTNRSKTLCTNTEKVLRLAEEFIRQSPQQWTATLPVWPEVLDLVPD